MEWFEELWDWFWWYRKGKIKYRVWNFGDSYSTMATDGIVSVWNCYGSTPKDAKEMALYKLKQIPNKEYNIIYQEK